MTLPSDTSDRDRQRARVTEAIHRFQTGQAPEASFRWLFESYFPPIRRFFQRRGFSDEESLDLTQETFLGIYRGLSDFRRDSSFETWLFRVATTTYLKAHRRGATVKRRGIELSTDDETSGVELSRAEDQLRQLLTAEQSQMLRAAIDELPEQMRQCLALRVYQDMAYKEIAAVMRLSIETVKVHLFKARKKLRRRLQGHFTVSDGEAPA